MAGAAFFEAMSCKRGLSVHQIRNLPDGQQIPYERQIGDTSR